MSGPKVVTIVTREEVEAICRGLLGQLRAASREFLVLAGRLDQADEALRTAVAAREAEAAALMTSERFLDLQKRVPQMVEFLREEGARLERAATLAMAERRSRRRRVVDGARSVVAALEAAGMLVDAAVRDLVARAARADDADLASLAGEVAAAARRTPAPSPADGPVRASSELAARLGAGLEGRTIAQWTPADGPAPDARDVRLDALLAEAEATCTGEEFAAVSEGAALAAAEPSAGRRGLLVDSVTLEVSRTVARRRALQASLRRLRDLDASLEALETGNASAMRSRVSAAIASDDATLMDAVAIEAAEVVGAETRALAATARRKAVLEGLARLGYEVRGSMVTAWARDGRVVVHKPGSQDYGVELGAPADASRVQVRLVGSDRPGSGRSAERDRDHEVGWCGDFSDLREHLAGAGGLVVVERASEPGAQAVKTVPAASLGAATAGEVSQPTAKAMRR
ncbi:hypothetical protein [Lichenibacterium ramalinae]|uniref:Uncharacterized protein n=1 Tax=Lichenibacterium ramalinae TaxID=2316527 RepID=A0A4V1RIL4_9HYPH|nr:hypothetical protein [Lichenibacterium ramalinae]RYB04421.1 hypothetical protein D3272_13340 [Lichenibacterium ramalinae]